MTGQNPDSVRILVSPVSKFRFFLTFTGLWSIAVFLPLVPAVVVVAIISGPAMMVPAVLGTVLAVALGTLAGLMARGLSEAHLAAILLSALIAVLSFVKTPAASFLPFVSLTSGSADAPAFAASLILTVGVVFLSAGIVSRSG